MYHNIIKVNLNFTKLLLSIYLCIITLNTNISKSVWFYTREIDNIVNFLYKTTYKLVFRGRKKVLMIKKNVYSCSVCGYKFYRNSKIVH